MNDLDKLIRGLVIFKKYDKFSKVLLDSDIFHNGILEVYCGREISEEHRDILEDCGWHKTEPFIEWKWRQK